MDRETAARMVSSLGGGMGRLREVCGAVSAMFLVAGLLYGYNDPKAKDEKAEHYERIQKLASDFEKENGSIICRELLGLTEKKDSPIPEERTAEYYKKRPCKELVGCAVEILERYGA
jgi:C_GCAxxG_C_C family probable redox protein